MIEKAKEMEKIPEGWKMVRLGEVFEESLPGSGVMTLFQTKIYIQS